MLFQAIKPLLANGKLLIELALNKDDTISVVVTQKGEGPLATPLPLTAMAEELDAEFVTYILQFGRARKSHAEQFATTEWNASASISPTMTLSSAVVSIENLLGARARLSEDGYAFIEKKNVELGFVLTPVPEPESYAMLLAGLGLMGLFASRRASQA